VDEAANFRCTTESRPSPQRLVSTHRAAAR
jgi:hypothetical protein